jgi:large subunit ribosomal protein L29
LKANEIRTMSIEEMNKQLEAAYQQLWDLHLKANTRQLVNHREIPRVKKQIAALKTILRERKLESQERPA